MALTEKVEIDDLWLLFIMENPVLFGEFVANIDYDENSQYHQDYFEYTDYQENILLDFNNYVCIRGGRSLGKSVALRDLLVWAMVYDVFPGSQYILTTPGRSHLEPLFTFISRAFRTNSFLRQFIAKNQGINNSDFTIELLSKAKLLCRIAGNSGDGKSVNAIHSPFEILDEAGFYPWGTFQEFIPTLNTWVPGHRRIVAGVPIGLREKNVLYFCDQTDSAYSKHRISALQNPRFTKDDLERAIVQYGGEGSDEFERFVKGNHGSAITALFDRALMEIGDDPVYKLYLDGIRIAGNMLEYMEKLSIMPPIPNKSYKCFFGIDLGYVEPTAIFIMYLDSHERMHFHYKLELAKVSYPIQEKIIDYLDTKYDPQFIGIDRGAGGQGISMTQHFFEDRQYDQKNYKERMIPVTFNETVSLGTGLDGNELKSKVKPYAVSILQNKSNDQKIVYSSKDLETVTELERMVYTKTPNGELIYRTLTEGGGKAGSDHFTAALLCAVFAYWQVNDSLKTMAKKKLVRPRWFMG